MDKTLTRHGAPAALPLALWPRGREAPPPQPITGEIPSGHTRELEGLTPVAAQAPGQVDPLLGDRLRNLVAENPAAITDILRPQPVFANGQQRGYRVYPGRNREVFTKLGLMPGDLVTAINGAPLDDPARGMEVMQTMNSATDVTVTVERNGQTTQININNAQIAAQAAAAAAQPEAIPVSEAPEVAPRQDQSE